MERFDTLKDLIPDVLLSAPECPDPVAYHALCHATSDVLLVSKAWQGTFSGDLVEDDVDVTLKEFPSALLDDVVSLKYEGAYLDRSTFRANSDGTIIFKESYSPSESTIDGVVCLCTLVTDLHATYIPPAIVREAAAVIIYLATSNLLLVPKTPYFNPDLSGYHKMKYEDALSRYSAKLIQNRRGLNRGFSG